MKDKFRKAELQSASLSIVVPTEVVTEANMHCAPGGHAWG